MEAEVLTLRGISKKKVQREFELLCGREGSMSPLAKF
jgi:hypothetical protein